MWKSFESLRWDTLKHAHPWKVVHCNIPNEVTIVWFHPYPFRFLILKLGSSRCLCFFHNVMDTFVHRCNPASCQCNDHLGQPRVNIGQNEVELPKKLLATIKTNIIPLSWTLWQPKHHIQSPTFGCYGRQPKIFNHPLLVPIINDQISLVCLKTFGSYPKNLIIQSKVAINPVTKTKNLVTTQKLWSLPKKNCSPYFRSLT